MVNWVVRCKIAFLAFKAITVGLFKYFEWKVVNSFLMGCVKINKREPWKP